MRIHYTATVWHGGFYEFVSRAFRSMGHEVVFFDEGGTKWQAILERVGKKIPRCSYGAVDLFRGRVSRDWLRSLEAEKPDLILLQHAPNILPEAVREARKFKKPIFYWMDSPTIASPAKDALAAFEYVDKIFTIDRSNSWMTILYGPGDAEFLPLAGDPDVFYPLVPGSATEYDVAFIGSLPPQSGDGYLRAKILADIPDRYRMAVCGTGLEYWYKYFPHLERRVIRSGRLSAAGINALYNKTKVLLNIHSTWHFTSVSARTFEAAFAGIFQIVDHRADHDELFPKDFLVTFKSAGEIRPLLEHWLASSADKERAKMAAQVRAHALAHHTWRHRAERMLKLLSELQSA